MEKGKNKSDEFDWPVSVLSMNYSSESLLSLCSLSAGIKPVFIIWVVGHP